VSKIILKNVCLISAADGFLAAADILFKPASPLSSTLADIPAVANIFAVADDLILLFCLRVPSVYINVDVADVVDIPYYYCPCCRANASAVAMAFLLFLATFVLF
jgi:hypothetical protein